MVNEAFSSWFLEQSFDYYYYSTKSGLRTVTEKHQSYSVKIIISLASICDRYNHEGLKEWKHFLFVIAVKVRVVKTELYYILFKY